MCEPKTPNAVLQSLVHIQGETLHAFTTHSLDALEHLSVNLQNVAHAVELLIENKIFPNANSQNRFLKAVKVWTDRMTMFSEAWDERTAVYDEGEVLAAKKCFWHASTKSPRMITLPWFGYGANHTKLPTEDQLSQAEKKGFDVHLRTQRLPRGCLIILEYWRKDVDAVIQPILQVSGLGKMARSCHSRTSADGIAG